MTDSTGLAEIREQLEELEQRSEEISEVLHQDRREVEIEVVDENVPVIAVEGIEMMPTEQVSQWFEDLRDRMDDVAEIAEEREQQRQELEQELDGLEQLMANAEEDESWVECTIDKAYKSQETLLEDGQYCALGPEFAEEIGLSERDELKLRRAEQPEKSAVYIVDEVRGQDAKVRIAKKGRERIDGTGSFEGEVLPVGR